MKVSSLGNFHKFKMAAQMAFAKEILLHRPLVMLLEKHAIHLNRGFGICSIGIYIEIDTIAA